MKRTEAVDIAMEWVADGRTAYICHNEHDGIHVKEKPSGTVVLIVKPEDVFPRDTMISILAHRMRMKKVA